jgi:6-pyruvoyltetrahydropterin/6-carboxytetrahydropterin synthase
VLNIKRLDTLLDDLLEPLDHRLLNEILPECAQALPTTEHLALWFWARLPGDLEGARKVALRLEEEPGLYVELEETLMPAVLLTRSIEFAAAHRLHSPHLSDEENVRVYGKCNNLHGHGHNYVAEITVKGEPAPVYGTVLDLGRLDRLLVEEIETRFDHKHLNLDTPYFHEQPCTAENIAKVLWELLEKKIPGCRDDGQVRLHRVRLHETARSWFDYFGG